MKKKIACTTVLIGLVSSAALAGLELQKQLVSDGPRGVGIAVKEAAASVYSGPDSSDKKIQAIAGILDEAIATGNETAVRYSVVAIVLAGGNDNLEVSRKAVNNRLMFSEYQDAGLRTLNETIALMTGAAPQPVVVTRPTLPELPVLAGRPEELAAAAKASAEASRAVDKARAALESIEKGGDPKLISIAKDALRRAEEAAAKTVVLADKVDVVADDAVAQAEETLKRAREALKAAKATGNSAVIEIAQSAFIKTEKAVAEALELAGKAKQK